MTSPMPFVVVASPETAPRSPGGMSLKSSPHASVITVPPAIATRKIEREVPGVPLAAETAGEQSHAVDGGRRGDHPREADPVAEPAGEQRRDDVAGGDGREDVGRRDERLAETDRDVQDGERAGAGERPLPRRVGREEGRDVAVRPEHAPGVRDVGPHTLEDAPVAAVLGDEHDRHEARARHDPAQRRGTAQGSRGGTGSRRRSGRRRWRSRGRRAGRPGRARRRDPGGGPGRGRGTAARRRSRRRRARRASAPSSRGSA